MKDKKKDHNELDALDKHILSIMSIESENEYPLWSKKNFNDSLMANDYFKILTNNNLVCAFIVVKLMDHECELINLGVTKIFQKKGLATLLIKNLINYCQQNQVNEIFLEVRKSNFKAIKLYDKLNFNELGTRFNYYNNKEKKEDAIIMGLNL